MRGRHRVNLLEGSIGSPDALYSRVICNPFSQKHIIVPENVIAAANCCSVCRNIKPAMLAPRSRP
jgi:hypothetical protein